MFIAGTHVSVDEVELVFQGPEEEELKLCSLGFRFVSPLNPLRLLGFTVKTRNPKP